MWSAGRKYVQQSGALAPVLLSLIHLVIGRPACGVNGSSLSFTQTEKWRTISAGVSSALAVTGAAEASILADGSLIMNQDE